MESAIQRVLAYCKEGKPETLFNVFDICKSLTNTCTLKSCVRLVDYHYRRGILYKSESIRDCHLGTKYNQYDHSIECNFWQNYYDIVVVR